MKLVFFPFAFIIETRRREREGVRVFFPFSFMMDRG